jgi:hypothetical protein
MKHSIKEKMIAVVILSACTAGNVYAADKFDKEQLVAAAKQIGQSTDFEEFEAELDTGNANDTTPDETSVSNTSEAPKTHSMGALPIDKSSQNRLALYGKQKLVIHDQSQELTLAIEGFTKVFPKKAVKLAEPPTPEENELVEPVQNNLVITPVPKTENLQNTTSEPPPDKLKESMSFFKSLFTAPDKTDTVASKN